MEFGRQMTFRSKTKLTRTKGLYIFPIAGSRKWIDVSILIFINFWNYADRFNLAGLIEDIQMDFKISDDEAGGIQAIYRAVYMLSAPVFGVLGDRYNRKFLLTFGILVWNAANVGASYMYNYWAFLAFRALFGVGQACYTAIAPTIIGDLLVGDTRSRVLTAFFMGVPVGNGFGYIAGPVMATWFGDWRHSLRYTPVLSVGYLIVLIVFLKEPKRGLVEGAPEKESPLSDDLKYLAHNRSYIFCTLGFTALCFTAGVIQWWTPKLIHYAFLRFDVDNNFYETSEIFGAVAILAGIIGISLGYFVTFKLRDKYPHVDPLVCSLGLVVSCPFLLLATVTTTIHKVGTYILLCFGFMFMNVNWSIIMDICMSVIEPARRSTAFGVQLLIATCFGDALSPYIAGVASEQLTRNHQWPEFEALRVGYIAACVVEVVGGVCFFLNSFYVLKDVEEVRRHNEGLEE